MVGNMTGEVENMSDDLVTIANFNVAHEAWLVRGLLIAEGIPCVIQDEIVGSMNFPPLFRSHGGNQAAGAGGLR
jgi:hypothetical protein